MKIMKMKLKNKHIIFILFFLIILKIIFSLTRYHYVLWDESVYIGMGKYIYSAGQLGLWEPIRPVVLPLLLGIFWKLNLPIVFFAEILMLGFSLGTVLLTYLIAKELFDKNTAVIAAVLLVITPVFLYGTFSILTGIPTAFFILLALYLYIKKKCILLVGIVVGIVSLTRFPAGLILPAIMLILWFDIKTIKKRLQKYAHLFLGFAISIIPFCIINYISYRKYTGNAFDALFRPWLLASMHQSNVVHEISSLLMNVIYYPWMLLQENIFLIFILLGLFFLTKKQKTIYLPLALFFIYFTYISNKQVRFSLLFLPFICIIASAGLLKYSNFIRKLKKYKQPIIFISFMFVLLVLSLSLINISKQYYFFPQEKPKIIDTYYTYFEKNNISGNILTTDPMFVAYTDVKLVPYYNNVDDAIEVYNYSIQNSVAVVYNKEFFPCYTDECSALKQEFFERIMQENKVIFEQELQGQERYILLTPHYYFLQELKESEST